MRTCAFRVYINTYIHTYYIYIYKYIYTYIPLHYITLYYITLHTILYHTEHTIHNIPAITYMHVYIYIILYYIHILLHDQPLHEVVISFSSVAAPTAATPWCWKHAADSEHPAAQPSDSGSVAPWSLKPLKEKNQLWETKRPTDQRISNDAIKCNKQDLNMSHHHIYWILLAWIRLVYEVPNLMLATVLEGIQIK
jgi:hypothetical protein